MIGPNFPIRRPIQTPPWYIIPIAMVSKVSSVTQKVSGAIDSYNNTQREALLDSQSF